MDTFKIELKIFGIFIVVLSILASCIFLFVTLQKTPEANDYSYLKEYPSGQALILNDEVKVENIKDLYYTSQSSNGNTTVWIHDIHKPGFWNGILILSYQGMRLNFDYDIEIVEVGNQNRANGKETATTIKIISKDKNITGSMIVKISTEGMLKRARALSVFPWFVIGCVFISIIEAIISSLISYPIEKEEKFENKSYADRKEKIRLFIAKNYNLTAKENIVYREFLADTFLETGGADVRRRAYEKAIAEIYNKINYKKRKSKSNSNKRIASVGCWTLILSGLGIAAIQFLFGIICGGIWFFMIPLAIAIASGIVGYKMDLVGD